MNVTPELLEQYQSSQKFLAHRALTERDEDKRRQIMKEYAQCVSERARARMRLHAPQAVTA